MVLVAPGVLLGGDDVDEPGDVDDYSADFLILTAPPQDLERNISAVAVAKFAKNVDRACISHPGGTPERKQRLSIELNGKLTSLVVGHAADTKSGIEFAERISEPTQVGESTFGHAVNVARRPKCAVCTGTQSPTRMYSTLCWSKTARILPGSNEASGTVVGRNPSRVDLVNERDDLGRRVEHPTIEGNGNVVVGGRTGIAEELLHCPRTNRLCSHNPTILACDHVYQANPLQ